MATRADSLLRRLDGLRLDFEGAGETKRALLEGLEKARLGSARGVEHLHEILCFLRAYPDDAELLGVVERMLAGFDGRTDLKRHADELADTGIAGTEIRYRFYADTMKWLVERWGDRLHVDWEEFENADRLEEMLHLLALYTETPGLDEIGGSLAEWIDRLKGPAETDAEFLVRRFFALETDEFLRQAILEDLDIPMVLEPGPDTPARTRAKTCHVLAAPQSFFP